MSSKQTDPWLTPLGLVACVLFGLLALQYTLLRSGSSWFLGQGEWFKVEQYGQLGDSMAPFATMFAFMALVVTLRSNASQQKEIELQREMLERQTKALLATSEAQMKAMELQRGNRAREECRRFDEWSRHAIEQKNKLLVIHVSIQKAIERGEPIGEKLCEELQARLRVVEMIFPFAHSTSSVTSATQDAAQAALDWNLALGKAIKCEFVKLSATQKDRNELEQKSSESWSNACQWQFDWAKSELSRLEEMDDLTPPVAP